MIMPIVYRCHNKDEYIQEPGINILKQDSKILNLILHLQVIMQIIFIELKSWLISWKINTFTFIIKFPKKKKNQHTHLFKFILLKFLKTEDVQYSNIQNLWAERKQKIRE